MTTTLSKQEGVCIHVVFEFGTNLVTIRASRFSGFVYDGIWFGSVYRINNFHSRKLQCLLHTVKLSMRSGRIRVAWQLQTCSCAYVSCK